MARDTLLPVLGRCPLCDQHIASQYLLATYETDDEWPRLLAECPTCAEVVHPR